MWVLIKISVCLRFNLPNLCPYTFILLGEEGTHIRKVSCPRVISLPIQRANPRPSILKSNTLSTRLQRLQILLYFKLSEKQYKKVEMLK